jgi:hypothetical protein
VGGWVGGGGWGNPEQMGLVNALLLVWGDVWGGRHDDPSGVG